MFENYPTQNYNNVNMSKFIQYPEQWDLARACRNITNNTLFLDPKWQREYVWTIEKASALIESFLLDIPIPHIFLHWETETKRTVIDGKQRLISIYNFIEKQKWGEDDFRLVLKDIDPETNKKISKKWDGKLFNELTPVEQDKLKDATLNVINFRGDDNEMIFSIFERLNTGGVKLNPIQIINSMYPKIGKILKDISDSNDFQKFCQECFIFDEDDKKEWNDLDFILKILCLSHSYQTYKAPLHNFKISFCKQNKNNEDLLNSLLDKFLNTIKNDDLIQYLKNIPCEYKKTKQVITQEKQKNGKNKKINIEIIKPSILEVILSIAISNNDIAFQGYEVFNSECFKAREGTAATKTIKNRFDEVLKNVKK